MAIWLTVLASASKSHGEEESTPLREWHEEIARIRVLAENDAPLAYKKAQYLQTVLPPGATLVEQAKALNLLARVEIYLAQTELAAKHIQLAYETAAQGNDRIGQIEAELNAAVNSVNQGRIDTLISSATHSLTLLEGINRPDLQVEALLRAAMMYRRVGQLDESVQMAMQAMEIAKQHPDDRMMQAYAHQGLAISYEQSDHFKEAAEHFSEMARHARAAHSKLLEAYALSSHGGAAFRLGNWTAYEDNVAQAIALFRQSGNPFALGHGLFAQAQMFRLRKQYPAAMRSLNEAVEIYERYPNQIGLWWCLDARTGDYRTLGNLGAALADAERAYGLAKAIQLPTYRSQSAQRLAELAALHGDYRRAYALSAEANDLMAKASREKTSTRVKALAERYESESKRRRIDELTRRTEQQATQQRWLWTVLVGSFAMLAASAYFLMRLRRSHRLQEEANAQLEQSRKELEQQTAILQSILDSMGDGVLVVDEQGHLVLANPAAKAIAAIRDNGSQEDTLYSSAGLYLPDKTTPYPIDQLPLVKAILGHSSSNVEVFVHKPAVPQGRWLSITARPLLDRDQVIRGGVAVLIDITAQKEAAARLQESEQKFRTLAENSPDVIVRYDRDCRRLYVNPSFERLLGLPASRVLDKVGSTAEWQRCINVTVQEYRALIQQVIATGTATQILLEWRVEAGFNVVTYATTIVPERLPSGEIVGAIAVGHNITALKEAERKLAQSYTMLRQLAARRETAREEERARIARELHDELGQLLTALRLGISTLRLQFGSGNQAFTERIAALTELADSTLQGIRDVATLLRPPALDMGIVAALEWLISEFERHTGIRCEFSVAHPSILIEENRAVVIFRLVQESLTNIARHSEAQSVKINLKTCDNGYQLEIRDDGKGFDPTSIKAHSFGLAGMRERSAILGGELVVDTVQGQGTVIRIHIPENQPLEKLS